jgi:hypothetical protein
MEPTTNKAPPGSLVVLKKLPPGLTRGLPRSDQKAIREIVGKPIRLVEYDDDGRAELEFTDESGAVHFIYVNPVFLEAAR